MITGNPGSGKTSLAAELARRGCAVIDADDIAGWETFGGVPVTPPDAAPDTPPVTPPDAAPDDWLLNHRWVWARSRVAAVIAERSRPGRPLFVCGIAVNQREMLDLFDHVFLLTLDHETQIARLNAPSNAHRTAALRAQILDGRPVFEAQMRAAGAIALDGRLPTLLLAGRITDELATR